jgi:regulator of sirC expression with transglutaminase-like and TPR domain
VSGGAEAKPETLLRAAGASPDDRLDIARLALALAALDRPRVRPQRYHDHLDELAGDLRAAAAGAPPGDAEAAAALLRQIMAGRHRYQGDADTYEDMQNANLMRVIDRRRGLPVALGILYMHAARGAGWTMAGLDTPGHFLVRLEAAGGRVVLDPFAGGASRTAAELRALLQRHAGGGPAPSPAEIRAVTDRDVLLRLQNNIKLRALRAGDGARAHRVLESMTWLAPQAPPVLRELALVAAHEGQINAAIATAERLIEIAQSDGQRHEAALLLQQLRGRLN